MPVAIPYLVKLFVCLTIVMLFYQLVLRRLTFYAANRWYLLVFTLLSFLVPLINVSLVVQEERSGSGFINYIPLVQEYSISLEDATHCPIPLFSAIWTKWDWILLVLSVGAGLLLIRFLIRCISFFMLKRSARLIIENGTRVYQVDKSIIPFSFGNSIFINSNLHTEEELKEIIHHEFIHVRQKHTVDIIWAEIFCMINWYNPAAWILRNAIRQNLEFIADNKVLENGMDRKQYQYLLLKVVGNDQFSIAHKFNFSSLKKRIAMMNKSRSAKVHLLRFLFLLPLLAVILISFREKVGNQQVRANQDYTDTVPPAINSKGFRLSVTDNKGECTILIKDRAGSVVEKVPLNKWNASSDFYESKYGELPPPPPPIPVRPAKAPTAPTAPVAPVKSDDIIAPSAPTPPNSPDIDPRLATLSDNFEITDTKAIIHTKDKKVEEYDLTDAADKARFEKKWGKIIRNDDIAPVAIVSHGGGQTVIAPMTPHISADHPLVISDHGAVITGKEDVLVTITKYTTRQQLDKIKEDMKQKGIELTYEEIEYNSKGVLTSLNGTLRSGDGRSNFVVTDFEKLTLAMIKYEGKTYFKVITTDSKDVS